MYYDITDHSWSYEETISLLKDLFYTDIHLTTVIDEKTSSIKLLDNQQIHEKDRSVRLYDPGSLLLCFATVGGTLPIGCVSVLPGFDSTELQKLLDKEEITISTSRAIVYPEGDYTVHESSIKVKTKYLSVMLTKMDSFIPQSVTRLKRDETSEYITYLDNVKDSMDPKR